MRENLKLILLHSLLVNMSLKIKCLAEEFNALEVKIVAVGERLWICAIEMPLHGRLGNVGPSRDKTHHQQCTNKFDIHVGTWETS